MSSMNFKKFLYHMGDFFLSLNLLYGIFIAGSFLFDLNSLYRLPNTTVLGFCFYLLFSFAIKKLYKAYGPAEDSSPVYSDGWSYDDLEYVDEYDSYFRAYRASDFTGDESDYDHFPTGVEDDLSFHSFDDDHQDDDLHHALLTADWNIFPESFLFDRNDTENDI